MEAITAGPILSLREGVKVRVGLSVLLSLGLVCACAGSGSLVPSFSSSSSSSNLTDIERALDHVESALDAVEEIQTAEALQEAQALAAEAGQELKNAISILEEIELPNWLWLLEQGALYWHGPILDQATKEPVQAGIFVNGRFIAQAREVQLLMWETEDQPVWVEIKADGYKPWGMRFRFRLKRLEVIAGPVWLVRG